MVTSHLGNKNSIYFNKDNTLDLGFRDRRENINSNFNQIQKQDSILKNLLFKIYENIDIFKYCADIVKNEGLSVLFDGMSSSVFGGIMQNGIYFCAVKIFNYLFKYFKININNGILKSMAINLLSAICTAFITNPIWVLNIRMAKKSKEVKLFYIFG